MFKKKWCGYLLLPFCLGSLAQASAVVGSLSLSTGLDSNIYSQSEVSDQIGNVDLRSILTGRLQVVSWQGSRVEIRSPKDVKSVYTDLGYQLLWSKDNYLTDAGYRLIKRVIASKEDALLPEIYHSDVFSTLSQNSKVYDPELLDVILTDSFVTLESHLTNGIVNPKKQFSTWDTPKVKINYAESIRHVLSNPLNIKRELIVDNADYQALKKEYVRLYQRGVEQEFIKVPAEKLTLGDQGQAVSILRQRLNLSEGSQFDSEVLEAVKIFQKNNNLSVDGVVGANTRSLLNQSPSEKLEVLAINMERYRWANVPSDTNYIWVNIPSYNMKVVKDNHTLFQSNVIVGQFKRQTPVFSDTLQYVVLNPYWNVPKTIYSEDKLPRLRRDPYSLGSNFQVLSKKTGHVVDPASVNWDTESRLYRLRELPGRHNALGRMKFLFPNSHDIYLHDTPQRQLFKRGKRALSSGCVRVEHAHDLADFLLEQMGWSNTKVSKYSTGKKEKWIKLDKNLNYPVFINYYTSWVTVDHQVSYSLDIYHKDEELKKIYKQKLMSYL